jgi:hypothetical protein
MSIYIKDLTERVSVTFLGGFFTALFADWTGAVPSDWKDWLLFGAGAGVISVVKGLVAKGIGDPASAAFLSDTRSPK